MSDELRCHYCGAECVFHDHAGIAWSACLKCGAWGPECRDASAARRAHAGVMRAPVWTKEPPEGWALEEYSPPGGKVFVSMIGPKDSRGRHPHYRYSALVMPAEPAEGGGE